MRVPEESGELAIGANDVVVLIEQRDCFGRVLEQGGEINTLRLESVVELFAVGDVDGDSDGPRDVPVGRPEGLDPGLE